MKAIPLLLLLLATYTAYAQESGIRTVYVAVPYQSQAQVDTAQNQKLRDMASQLSAMNTMTQTLATDGFTSIVGSLVDLLTLGAKKGVYNTTIPLPETWVGTSAGNRLLSMRIVDYPVTVTAGQTVITIPHGLPYTPVVQVSVKSPAGVGAPAYIANATNIVVTLPTGPLVPTPYVFNWIGR